MRDGLKMENDVRNEIDVNHNIEDAIIEIRLRVVSDISKKTNQMGGH